MMPMYSGEDGAATWARVAAAAASLAWVDALAVLVATFLRTLDLGTCTSCVRHPPVSASPGLYVTGSSLRCAAPDAVRSTAARVASARAARGRRRLGACGRGATDKL